MVKKEIKNGYAFLFNDGKTKLAVGKVSGCNYYSIMHMGIVIYDDFIEGKSIDMYVKYIILENLSRFIDYKDFNNLEEEIGNIINMYKQN